MRKSIITTTLEKYRELPLTLKAGLWFAICAAYQQGLNLLLTPVFTRLLSIEEYGLYNLYASWTTLITAFITLNIAGGVFNNAMIKFKDNIQSYMSSMIGLISIIGIVFLGLCDLGYDWLNQAIKLPLHWIVLMVFQIITSFSFALWTAKERFDFQYKRYCVVSFISFTLQFLCSILVLLLCSNKVEAKIYVSAGLQILEGILFSILICKRGKTFFCRSFWSYAISFSIPLLPHYLSQIVLNQSDRVMISWFCSEDAVGLYSLAYNIAIAISFVTSCINTVFIPFTYKKIEQNDFKSINKVSKKLLVLVLCFVSLVCLFAPEFVCLLGSRKYLASVRVVPPVVVGLFFVFVYTLFANVEFFFEKKYFIAIASSVVAVINILLNYIFIPLHGYAAASYTTLFCYLLYAVIHYFFMSYTCKQKNIRAIYDMRFILILSIVGLSVVVISLLLYSLPNIYRFICFVIFLVSVFILRKKLILFLKDN